MAPQERMAEVMRSSYGRLLSILASQTGDILIAEDALSDAFAKALIHWPNDMPKNPEAWLLTVARNRLIDIKRRDKRIDFRDTLPEPPAPEREHTDIPDDRLKLMFVCAHPAIDTRMHTPLMLQTVLGLGSELIARAYLLPHSTMAKRLVRAKQKIRDTAVAFQIPATEDMPSRVSAVLEAIYGAFSQDWMGEGLFAEEALFLATLLADLMPNDAEVLGLAALIAFSLSRKDARIDGDQFLPLEDQDPTKWDVTLMVNASSYLGRAQSIGQVGRFQLEAAIQSVHADRLHTGVTNWVALVHLHLGLSRVAPTVGSAVSYAAALGKAGKAEDALRVLLEMDETILVEFAPAQATLAYLWSEVGRPQDAVAAYDTAISLTPEPPLRRYLERKRNELRSQLL